MQTHRAPDLGTDTDFFDWLPGGDPRFFIAPELAIGGGRTLRPAQPASATASPVLAIAYQPEMPRSAS